jgi:hypothetical protein
MTTATKTQDQVDPLEVAAQMQDRGERTYCTVSDLVTRHDPLERQVIAELAQLREERRNVNARFDKREGELLAILAEIDRYENKSHELTVQRCQQQNKGLGLLRRFIVKKEEAVLSGN